MVDNSDHILVRVLHYLPCKSDEELSALRAAAHEDINLLNILPSANESGLQAKAKDSSSMEVPCDSGTLLINIADILQEVSAGDFYSTSHRVINLKGAANTQS